MDKKITKHSLVKKKKLHKVSLPPKEVSIFHNPIFQIGVALTVVLSFYISYSTFANDFVSLSKTIERENSRYVRAYEQLSLLMILPSDTPIIAQISEPEILKKDLAFYNDSKEGDYVFIFPSTQQAIIYRQSENKIINQGILANPKK